MTRTAPPTPRSRRGQNERRAVVYGVLDQCVSSATNFLALLATVNLVDRYQFGHFSIAYVSYTLLVGAAQALFGQVIVLEGEHAASTSRAALRSVLRTASMVAAPLVAVATLTAPTSVRGVYVCLAAFLPVLLAQDVLRYAASALRIPRTALTSDTIWFVSFLGLILMVANREAPVTASTIMGAWCTSGTLAYAWIWLSTRPWRIAGGGAGRLLRNRSYLGYRFLVEFALTRAVSQISMVALGLVATVVATGAIRGVSTLFGPINILITSVVVFVTPVLVREPGNRTRLMTSIATALCALSIALTAALAWVPARVGNHLLGDTWRDAAPLVVPIGLQVAVLGVGAAAFTGLRVVNPKSTLPIRSTTSAASLVLFPIGYLTGGVVGFAWSLAAIAALQGTWAWLAYLRIAQRSTSP